MFIKSFIWDVVRNHSSRFNELHGFAFILEGVRTYTLRISFDFYKFWSILQGVPREISLDFCGLVSPLGLHSIFMDSCLLCKGYPSGLHYIFCDSWHVRNLDATPLHQGCDGTEIEYSTTCNEGRDAAGSAWCPQSPGHGFPHIITSDS